MKLEPKGFTLIEILVALTLMAMAIMSFSLTTMGISRGHASSRNLTAAIHLAQDKLEQIQALPLAAPVCPSAKLPACSGIDDGLNSLGTTEPPGLRYQRAWRLLPETPEPGLVKAEVTVSWTERQVSHEFVLSTLLYRP